MNKALIIGFISLVLFMASASASWYLQALKMPQANTNGVAAMGSGIAGFASTADQDSIMVYNEQQNYGTWEFVFDPSKQKPVANPNGGTQGTPASQLASPNGPQPGQPMNSPFGGQQTQSPFGGQQQSPFGGGRKQ